MKKSTGQNLPKRSKTEKNGGDFLRSSWKFQGLVGSWKNRDFSNFSPLPLMVRPQEASKEGQSIPTWWTRGRETADEWDLACVLTGRKYPEYFFFYFRKLPISKGIRVSQIWKVVTLNASGVRLDKIPRVILMGIWSDLIGEQYAPKKSSGILSRFRPGGA